MNANKQQTSGNVEDIRFTDFHINCGKSSGEIKFSPVNNGRAVYLEYWNQYKIKFNVFNSDFIGYLEIFLDMNDGSCISRFTNYKCDKNRSAHYVIENIYVLLPKKFDMNVAIHAGKQAAEYYLINSKKKLTEWKTIDEPLEIARAA